MNRTTTTNPLVLAVAALVLLDVVGIVLAVTGDLRTVGDAIVNGSKVNAPLVIVGAQAGGVALWRFGRGRWSRAGLGLCLAACTLSLAAVAFDGDLGHAGLTSGQVAYQVVVSACTAVLWLLTVLTLAGRPRRVAAPEMIGA